MGRVAVERSERQVGAEPSNDWKANTNTFKSIPKYAQSQ